MRRGFTFMPDKKINFGRRALMKFSLLGGGAIAASRVFGGLIPASAWAADGVSKYEGPVVETTAGKIRGVVRAARTSSGEFLTAPRPREAAGSCRRASRTPGRE